MIKREGEEKKFLRRKHPTHDIVDIKIKYLHRLREKFEGNFESLINLRSLEGKIFLQNENFQLVICFGEFFLFADSCGSV